MRTTNPNAIAFPTQRKSFYGVTRYWQFWSDGINIVYDSSADGVTWTGIPTVVRPSTSGRYFGIHYDATSNKLSYAWGTDGGVDALYYRRGTPSSNGIIMWDQAEQKAMASATGEYKEYPSIAVDSYGYPYIEYSYQANGVYYICVTKSSTNDGTWTTDTSYPVILATVTPNCYPLMLPLTSGKMVAIYGTSGAPIKARECDGAAGWGAEQATASILQDKFDFSAISVGDTAYLVFTKQAPYATQFTTLTYFNPATDTWSSEIAVQTSTAATVAPILAINSETGDLYCFWLGIPKLNHVYYKKYTVATATWDTNPVDWMTDALTANNQINTTFASNGGSIGVTWLTNYAGGGYDIRFSIYSKHLRTITYQSSPIMVGATINGVIIPSGQSVQVDDGSVIQMTVPLDVIT